MDPSIKSLFLVASTDGLMIPTEPVQSLQDIVQAKTGTIVKMKLHQKHSDIMINVDVGFCTAILKGLILSLSSPQSINNLSRSTLLRMVLKIQQMIF